MFSLQNVALNMKLAPSRRTGRAPNPPKDVGALFIYTHPYTAGSGRFSTGKQKITRQSAGQLLHSAVSVLAY